MHAYARLQNFRRAVEEGKEVLDRRAGREPATQHAAWDALDDSDERNQVLIPCTQLCSREVQDAFVQSILAWRGTVS
jgi:hypothetical protein